MPAKTGEARWRCAECGEMVFTWDNNITLDDVLYHMRCYDRLARKREESEKQP